VRLAQTSGKPIAQVAELNWASPIPPFINGARNWHSMAKKRFQAVGAKAQVWGEAGRAQEGLACIDEALAEARTHNERWWDAELHRLRGELVLLHGADVSDGEAALLRAIAIARAQQARPLELRATMSLARLWITQHRSDDARRQLSDLYAWFTEGFETLDLQAARLLLAHL
jgi:predicted ATPase